MAKSKSLLPISAKAVDPALDALFASSSGPVKARPKSRYCELITPKLRDPVETVEAEEDSAEEKEEEEDVATSSDDEDEQTSEEDSEKSTSDDVSDEEDAEQEVPETLTEATPEPTKQDRKRKKRQDENYDLEGRYFDKLAREDSPASKRRKGETGEPTPAVDGGEPAEDDDNGEDDSDFEIPVHESLTKGKQETELEKAARTVFLSNVSTEAITSRKAKKALLAHLSTPLDKAASPPQAVMSLRFRSVPFSTAAMPKRAAYITRSLMDATTRATNAYAVFSTAAAARAAVAKLNGSVVLDRHLRVDSVAHPMEVDHRRCVFVGNLGFVDDETVINTAVDEEGKETTEKRKRTKVPMDVEEGLWRTFGRHAGRVESVRVVRDQATRVGLGIAYVQFYDGNSVEAALLLNGKKYPPMLPRELRVSRCKAPHKTNRAIERANKGKVIASGSGSRKPGKANGYVRKVTAEEQTLAGRTGKLLGRSAAHRAGGTTRPGKGGAAGRLAAKDRKGGRGAAPAGVGAAGGGAPTQGAGFKTPEAIVFEGRRASAKDGKPRDLKIGRKGSHKKEGHGKKKPKARGAAK